MAKEGFYRRPEGTPEVERKRLTDLKYPNEVSLSLLDRDLTGRSILDVGAGSNPGLGQGVIARGGAYTALDVDRSMLQTLRETMGAQFQEIEEDIRSVEIPDKSFDIVHQRFVLMHQPKEEWQNVIEKSLHTAKEKIILLEWNWRPLASSTHPETVAKFRNAAFDLMSVGGIEPYAGEVMEEMLDDMGVKNVRVQKHIGEDGDYTEELKGLCQSGEIFAKQLQNEQLVREFSEMGQEFGQSSMVIRPQHIVSAVIETK